MKFDWRELPRPFAALSPMAGVTDSAFRQICKRLGADVLFTEMISAEALRYHNDKTAARMRFEAWEQPVIAQFMGAEPEPLAEAARAAEDLGFQGIDLNMGCPANKVSGIHCGSSLLRDPDLAARIVETVAHSVAIPVSVKMRAGFDASVQPEFARRMEQAGAAALTIHPRTKVQAYRGPADWAITRQVVEAVRVPVMGSGDVWSWSHAEQYIRETGIHGVFIARGAMGNPWIFMQGRRERAYPREWVGRGEWRGADYAPALEEMLAVVRAHARLMYALKGAHGIVEMRKHLGWYLRGFEGAALMRQRAVRVETPGQVEEILAEIEGQAAPARPIVRGRVEAALAG